MSLPAHGVDTGTMHAGRGQGPTATSRLGRWLEWAPLILLSCAVVLGGGVWNTGDVALSLLGLLVLAWGWFAQVSGHAPRWRRLEWGVVAAYALLGWIHCLALPWAVWVTLPGRSQMALDLAAAGVDGGWQWLSLDPAGTFRGLAALLPAMAMIICVRRGSDAMVFRLAIALVVLACGSVLLGMLQVAGGPLSPWRLHNFHNRTGALGFFAYRNLQATQLLMTLPVAVALMLNAYGPPQIRVPAFRRLLAALTVPVLLLGVTLTLSRAGLILGSLALCGCFVLYWTWPGGQRRWRALAPLLAAVVVGLALVIGFALPGLLDRLGENPLADGRWPLYISVYEVARNFQPVGAGLGAFEQVFQAAPPNVALPGAYMHLAHNEWLQGWLELGWLGLALGLIFMGVLARAAWRVWFNRDLVIAPSGIMLARAASISLLIAFVHSYFDYPLRTGANLVIFCLMAALVLRAGGVGPHRGGRGPNRVDAKIRARRPPSITEPSGATPQ